METQKIPRRIADATTEGSIRCCNGKNAKKVTKYSQKYFHLPIDKRGKWRYTHLSTREQGVLK